MSRELTDTEARDHYRDELNRTRKALRELAEKLDKRVTVSPLAGFVANELYHILGERP